MSGVYMLFRVPLIIVNYHIINVEQIGWLLQVLMFLSLSILIIILQPYKKSYLNVLDGLLLALMRVSNTPACHIPVHLAIIK